MHTKQELKKSDRVESPVLPSMSLTGLVKHFGPGMILMMTGIGTSHLITAPVAGGRFAFDLLWCIPVAYVFKYYGFEMAFRFTHATGRSILDAYATAWKGWPLWYVLITTLLQCAIGQAGRLVAAAAVLYYFFSLYLGLNIPIPIYALLLGSLSVGIILSGRYRVLELVAKISAGLLVLCAATVFLVKPAPLSSLANFFSFATPEGSWLIIAAFLGLLPTGIDVSLQASEWGKAKKVGTGRIRDQLEKTGQIEPFDPFKSDKQALAFDITSVDPHTLEYCRRWFKIALWDFRIGHVISFLLACIFLLLAAVWLYPSPIEGNSVIGEIAGIFTLSVGPWMMLIFLAGSFAATCSTAFNYFDGWPRVVGACSRNLFRCTSQLPGLAREDLSSEHRKKWYSEFNIYRIPMAYSLIAAVAMIAGFPRPVWLVLVASALALFVAPIIFFLNLYYCFSVIPKEDKVFYPSTFATLFSWGSLVVFTGLTFILIMARIFRVELFGA